jgi:hypothetical protein
LEAPVGPTREFVNLQLYRTFGGVGIGVHRISLKLGILPWNTRRYLAAGASCSYLQFLGRCAQKQSSGIATHKNWKPSHCEMRSRLVVLGQVIDISLL